MNELIAQKYESIKENYNNNKKLLWVCFISTYIFGLLAHAYGLLNNNLSHDALNAFIATEVEEVWKIELGRFLVPAYRAIFRGSISLPWLIGILGFFWVSLSVFLVIKLFDVKSKISTIIISALMITNITFISQIGTYVYEFDFNAFALLISILAVYVYRKCDKRWSIVAGSLLLLTTICIYQAYISVAAAMVVLLMIKDVLEDVKLKDIFKNFVFSIIMIIGSLVLYLFVSEIIYTVTGIRQEARTNPLETSENNIVLLYISLFKSAIIEFLYKLFHPSYNRIVLYSLIAAYISVMIVLFLCAVWKKELKIKKILILLLFAIILFFATQSIYFLSKGAVHDLMTYSYQFIYILILLLPSWLNFKTENLTKLKNVTKILSVCFALFLISQNIILANTAYIKKDTEAKATLSTMTRVLDEIESQDDYVYGETEVAFVGVLNHSLPSFDNVTYITGLAGNSSIPLDGSLYYYNGYKAYFDYVLNYPLNFCSDSKREELIKSDAVINMPSFPNEGYIDIIDGVMVIKIR